MSTCRRCGTLAGQFSFCPRCLFDPNTSRLGELVPPHPTLPSLGERINQYELVGELGRGGMGAVYLAADTTLGRRVAIKFVVSDTPALTERVLIEARATARCRHDNIVVIHEVSEYQSNPFIVLEYLEGVSLRKAAGGMRLSPQRAIEFMLPVVRAIACAHELGIVHRDLKPDNVLVTAAGEIKVMDFGIAQVRSSPCITIPTAFELGEMYPRSARVTVPGTVMGTVPYMAPEQWRGEQVDHRTDLWAIGVMLYELVAGAHPLPQLSTQQLQTTVCSDTPMPRADVPGGDLPAALADVIASCLRKRKRDRPDSAAAVAAVLEQILDSYRSPKTRADDDRSPDRSDRSPGSARKYRGILAAAAIGLMALGGYALQAGTDDRNRAIDRQREQQAAERLAVVEARMGELSRRGEVQAADDAFRAFTSLPEHRGTRALATGWLRHGERMQARADSDAEITAYANAYVAATPPDLQMSALRRLAATLRRTRSIRRYIAVARMLIRQGLAFVDARAARDIQIEAAMARRDLAHARRLVERDGAADTRHAALVEALSHVVKTRYLGPCRVDIDGDGREELFVWRSDESVARAVRIIDGTLAVVGRFEFSPDLPVFVCVDADSGSSSFILSKRGGENTLYGFDAGRMTALHRWKTPNNLHSGTVGDLDGDGRDEVYLGYVYPSRGFAALHRRGDDRWELVQPHPGTEYTDSDILDLIASDLDGDGTQELAVGAGPWSAYDVRLLRRGFDADTLDLAARRKLGTTHGVTTMPAPSGTGRWLVTIKTDEYPSRVMFAADRPYGEPAGVYFLAWNGARLEVARFLPEPAPGSWMLPIVAGDFNGDGLIDVAASVNHRDIEYESTIIYAQNANGSFDDVAIGEFHVEIAANLDDDRADELVVRKASDRTLWILGAGSETTTALDMPAPDRTVAPEEADPILQRVWERAEDLMAIGLPDRAAAQFEDLAALLRHPRAAARAVQRAAEARFAAGRYHDAALLYERAAESGQLAVVDMLAAAIRAYEYEASTADTLRIAADILAEPLDADARAAWTARVAELKERLDPHERIDNAFDAPLDKSWRISDPMAVRVDGRGLRIDSVASPGEQVLARQLIRWRGGPLTVELELDIERMEWSAGLEIALRRVGASKSRRLHWFHGVGGGGFLEYMVTPTYLEGANIKVDGPAVKQSLVVRWSLDPATRSIRHTARAPGRTPIQARLDYDPDAMLPGRYEVLFKRLGRQTLGSAHARFRIRRVLIGGARAETDADGETPEQRMNRHLANNEYDEALARLDESPKRFGAAHEGLLRYLILDELGRGAEADTSLTAALAKRAPTWTDDPDVTRLIRGLWRLRFERFGPALAQVLAPSEYCQSLWDSWRVTSGHHVYDNEVQRLLATQLRALDAAASAPHLARNPDRVQVLMRLFGARASARRQLGHNAAARADVDRALELGQTLLSPGALREPTQRRAIAQVMSNLHRIQAGTLVAMGEDSAALEELRRALAMSAAPEILADQLAIQPDLAGLRSHAEWREVITSVRIAQ